MVGRQNALTEEEIAKRAGEESPTTLYERIREDGHPICPKCGATYLDETHDCKPKSLDSTQNVVNTARARKPGPVEELPPASNAIPLFRKALDALVRDNEELRHRKETRQGRHYPCRTVSRKTVSNNEWDYFADLFGLDPVARDYLHFGGGDINHGTSSRAPLSPLPELISMYLLAGCEVEPLVEALHPNPSEADWSEITKYIEGRKVGARHRDGIKSIALRLASLIRGETLKKGKPPPGESGQNLNLNHRIAARRKTGVSDRQIYEELLIDFGLSKTEFPWDEFSRLAALGLKLP